MRCASLFPLSNAWVEQLNWWNQEVLYTRNLTISLLATKQSKLVQPWYDTIIHASEGLTRPSMCYIAVNFFCGRNINGVRHLFPIFEGKGSPSRLPLLAFGSHLLLVPDASLQALAFTNHHLDRFHRSLHLFRAWIRHKLRKQSRSGEKRHTVCS